MCAETLEYVVTLGHSTARRYVQGHVVALGWGKQHVLLAQTISFYSINNCLSSLVSLEVSAVVARGIWVLRSASRSIAMDQGWQSWWPEWCSAAGTRCIHLYTGRCSLHTYIQCLGQVPTARFNVNCGCIGNYRGSGSWHVHLLL